jgi:FkbM family methyltransferase
MGRKITLGIFEKNETQFLLRYVKKDDVCLDVGANIGYYTFLFSSRAQHVISVEPIAPNVDLIRLSASINRISNIRVISAAVAGTEGEADFFESDDTGLSSVAFPHVEQILNEKNLVPSKPCYKVPTVTIDSLHLPKLDIVKMDIEGYEYFALQGMAQTLESLRPRLLMIELAESLLNRFGSSIDAVISFLSQYGYKPMILAGDKLIDYTGQYILNDNLFFVQRGGAD